MSVREQIVQRRKKQMATRLRTLATQELQRLRDAKNPSREDPRRKLGLVDYVAALSPRWEPPQHLAPVAALFERAMRGETVRACVSVPAQFGKTTLIQHGIVQMLSRHPTWPVVYASYSADFAHDRSKEIRDLAREAGLSLRDDTSAAGRWRLVEGGGLLATGIGGPLTGYAAQIVVVDDPHKNREEAESRREREKISDWLRSTALTRISPTGSCIVVHTRWHPDDLIGRLEADGWEVVNLPAITADDESLWPSQRPRDFLRQREREVGPYEWAALYMGQPRARGGAVFSATPTTYATAPTELTRGIGLDLAYSAKTSADWSVAVVLGKAGSGADARYYVLDVLRAQMRASDFAQQLSMLRARWPHTASRIYAGGADRGALDFLALPPPRGVGLNVEVKTAVGDKYSRATPLAAAWNAGRVLVREGAAWLPDLCDEVARFTGQGDAHDDQIDALAAAFDLLAEMHVGSPVASAGRRVSADLMRDYAPRDGRGRKNYWG
jgi:predicted phage terminase large subunit-like protein